MSYRFLPNEIPDHVLGSDKAPLTLVEFADLQCAFCKDFHKRVFPQIKRKYIDPGMLRFVVIDMPLESHSYAQQAAQFAACAGKQAKYWEVYDAILRSEEVASSEELNRVSS